MKLEINELIVVEGKDDIAAVKKAIAGEVISTGGYGFKSDLVEILRKAANRNGVIIFTDPDTAGNQIRKKLNSLVPGCKNAYLPQAEGIKGSDIGIENASPEAIRSALGSAYSARKSEDIFNFQDLVSHGLTGSIGAESRRKNVGKYLGIGEPNSKQFLHRLNHLGITRNEFLAAIEKAGGN